MNGMLQSVSTLLTTVGIPCTPRSAGNGGPRGDGAAQPLQAAQQRGLLADDVGAGALDDRDVEALAEDGPRARASCDRLRRARASSAGTPSARARSRGRRRRRSPRAPCPRAAGAGCPPSAACRCRSPGRPRRRWPRSPCARPWPCCANSHLLPAGKPAPPRPRTSAALTASSSASGVPVSARCVARPVAGAGQHGLVEQAGEDRLGRGLRGPARAAASIAPGPASITSPSRTAGLAWQ